MEVCLFVFIVVCYIYSSITLSLSLLLLVAMVYSCRTTIKFVFSQCVTGLPDIRLNIQRPILADQTNVVTSGSFGKLLIRPPLIYL